MFESFEDAIGVFLSNITSGTVVRAQQNISSPALPYTTLNILSYGENEGYPAQTSNGDDTFTQHIKKLLTVSISTYGDTAAALIDLITDGIYDADELDLLKEAGLYFRTISSPIPLAIVIDGKWEQRYVVDITFGYAKDIINNLGYIDRVSGTFNSNDFDTNN